MDESSLDILTAGNHAMALVTYHVGYKDEDVDAFKLQLESLSINFHLFFCFRERPRKAHICGLVTINQVSEKKSWLEVGMR